MSREVAKVMQETSFPSLEPEGPTPHPEVVQNPKPTELRMEVKGESLKAVCLCLPCCSHPRPLFQRPHLVCLQVSSKIKALNTCFAC